MHLSGLNLYPIKSMGGIALQEAKIEERGLQYDRRWMLIDVNNRFVSQREHAGLALLTISIGTNGLIVTSPDGQHVNIPFESTNPNHLDVQIWNDVCGAVTTSKEIDQWFSDKLRFACRLVQMAPEARRPVPKGFAINNEAVSFADVFPYMLLSEGSLKELNGRLDAPVSMNRFRPNFVVSGADPFAEDGWRQVTIGSCKFHVISSCNRCVMTTVDQERGIRSGPEPLKTLATYRQKERGVAFGQNLIAAALGGTVQVGDQIVASTS